MKPVDDINIDKLTTVYDKKYEEFKKYIDIDNLSKIQIYDSEHKDKNNPILVLNHGEHTLECRFSHIGTFFNETQFWVWCWDQIVVDTDNVIGKTKLDKFNTSVSISEVNLFNQMMYRFTTGKSMMIKKDLLQYFIRLLIYIYDPLWIISDDTNKISTNLYMVNSIIKNTNQS